MKNKREIRKKILKTTARRVGVIAISVLMAASVIPFSDIASGSKADAGVIDTVKSVGSKLFNSDSAIRLDLEDGIVSTAEAATGDLKENYADYNGKNQFALVITNGNTVPAKDRFDFFSVEYEDTDGFIRREYPQVKDSFEQAWTVASSYTPNPGIDSDIKSILGFSNSLSRDDDYLKHDQTDIYFFKTSKPCRTFKGVYYQLKDGSKSNEWNVDEFKIVEIDKLYGLNKVGYYSSMGTVEFSGNVRMASTKPMDLGQGTKGSRFISVRQRMAKENTLSTKSEYYDTHKNNKTYYMNISLSDVNYGGIEALNTNFYQKRLGATECLYADIVYQYDDGSLKTETVNGKKVTIKGTEKHVYYPVIANALAYYIDSSKQAGGSYVALKDAISFAQSGENIPFKFTLNKCLEVKDVSFYYTTTGKGFNNQKLQEYVTLVSSGSPESSVTRARNDLASDDIHIAGIQMFNGATYQTNGSNYNINPSLTPSSANTDGYFYNAGSANGDTVKFGESMHFVLPGGSVATKKHNYQSDIEKFTGAKPKKGDFTFVGENILSNTYVLNVKTSTGKLPGTTSEVSAVFEYYSQSNGKLKKTNKLLLSELTNDFYGYWPGANAKSLSSKGANYTMENAAYYKGVSGGGEFSMMLQLDDVESFSSVTFYVGARGGDDWQVEEFQFYKVRKISPRVTQKIDFGTYGSAVTDRKYDRSLLDFDLVYDSGPDLDLLIKSGGNTRLSITGSSYNEEVQERTRDVSQYFYDMTLEDAQQDLGLGEIFKSYDIQVNVASNRTQTTSVDSCGSNNYFYFQLVFENGTSAYVLANTQITADGFRSGQTENFSIGLNMDYGNLIAINIIPDDTYEETDPLDRLCIDSINVIRSSDVGRKKMWVFSNIGWIGPDYSDEGDVESVAHTGRTAGELVYSFDTSYESVMFSMEIEFQYGEKLDKELDDFVGNVTADILYINQNDEERYMNGVQIVKAMYEYNMETPRMYYDDSYAATYGVFDGYMSDRESMFRPNSTDRFFVNISDCKEIIGMTIYPQSKNESRININAINVKMVMSEGTLKVTEFDEYVMKYKVDPVYITSAIGQNQGKEAPRSTGFYSKTSEFYYEFDENEIQIPEDESEPVNVISRLPVSKNDKLNIFVKLKYDDSSTSSVRPEKGGYNITAIYEYKPVGDSTGIMQGKRTLTSSGDTLYLKGASAENMGTLKNLYLVSDKTSQAYVEKCVVQQVRNNVVVNTYNLSFMGNVASLNPNMAVTVSDEKAADSVQTVYLQANANTVQSTLGAEVNDIAARIEYTSTMDGSSNQTSFYSPYVYLSDNGTERLYPGQVMEFNFTEANVDKILNIEIMPVGIKSVKVDKAVADCRSGSTHTYYSFANPVTAALGGAKMECTSDKPLGDGSVQIAEVAIQTIMDGNVDGSTAAADAEIGFVKGGSQSVKTLSLPNIQNYLVDRSQSGFSSAYGMQTIRFLVENMESVRNIKLIPKSADDASAEGKNATWAVGDLEFRLYENAKDGVSSAASDTSAVPSISRNTGFRARVSKATVGKTITQADGGYNVPLVNISIELDMSYMADNGHPASKTISTQSEKDTGTIVMGGSAITITPVIRNTMAENGFNVKVVERSESGAESEISNSMYSVGNGKITFTPPVNTDAFNRYYVVKVTSKESDQASLEALFEVRPTTTTEDTNNN